MADRPTTEHYGIAEYGPRGTEDPMDVYRVYNPAMETIDRILFGHEGEIGKLKNRMDAAEAAISALDTHEDKQHSEIPQKIAKLPPQLKNLKTEVNNHLSQLDGKTDGLWAAVTNIVNKAYGAGTVDKSTGAISWGDAGMLAVGNINVFSGSGYLRTRTGEQDNDLKAV